MSNEKLRVSDPLGEEVNEGTSLNHRRKWHSNPIGARRYQELTNVESQRDNLAQQLLKNLSNTKRNVSELLEKSKMTEWLKKNSNKSDISFDFSGLSSDSGVSLSTSADNEDHRHWQTDSSYLSPKDKWNINIGDNNLNITTDEGVSSDINQDRNQYEDIKDFYTPRSCWEEVGSFKGHDHNPPEKVNRAKEEETLSLSTLTCPKRVGRSADILARVQKTHGASSQFGLSGNETVERSVEDTTEKSQVIKRIARPTETERSDMILIRNKTCSKKVSERSVRKESESTLSNLAISREKSFNESKVDKPSGIAKSLIHLAQIKRTNQNSVAKFLKNLAGCSEEMLVRKESLGDCAIDDIENLSSTTSSLGCPSSESVKWNFPNSNRKREEKLRSLDKDMADYDISIRDDLEHSDNSEILTNSYQSQSLDTSESDLLQLPEENSLHTTKSEFKISSYATPRGIQNNLREASDSGVGRTCDMEVSCGEGKLLNGKNIREMNTQAALIYLSETLIESAQRAEMLLMQKMKEYNDLVCRDPPVRKMQDFACQAHSELLPERDCDTTLNEIHEKLTQELSDKNIRIKQLEIDKKKLRQALKKLNISVGKKYEGNAGCGRDIDGRGDTSSPRSISTEHSALKVRNENNGQFVQALKIENNLLHTLLKEMKAELDQENATILSLAKKLEMSLGKQTITKSTDVVKKLEDRLEQQEKMLKQEAMEARAVAKYVIMKYKKLIQEYKQKVRSHQETVDKLTNAIK